MLRICSYNIHGAVGGLDRRYRPARIIRIIQAINADVYGLQEVREHPGKSSVLDFLKAEAGFHTLFLKTLADRKGPYGNALVTRLPILQHFDVDLEIDPPGRGGRKPRYEARRAIFAKLQTEPNMHLWVVVTHLAVERAARHLQLEKMIGLIEKRIVLRHEPCVLMGDMNEWSRPVPFLRRLDQLFSNHLARRTFPAFFPVLPLDRIWLSRQVRAHRVWTHRGKETRLASDHLPICAQISCPTGEGSRPEAS